MMDWASGTEIYSANATQRLPIASMCKIMTLILCFDAIDSGNLTLDEMITVSDRAASMGGLAGISGGERPISRERADQKHHRLFRKRQLRCDGGTYSGQRELVYR